MSAPPTPKGSNTYAGSESVKLVVVGETSVGKTSIIHRFTEGNFTEDFKATVGADFSSHWIDVVATAPPSSTSSSSGLGANSSTRVQLHIWDTAGQERYRSLSLSYFKGCEAALVVFDVCSQESFSRLSFWLDEVLRGTGRSTLEGFPVFVVGNKVDVPVGQHKVTQEAAAAFTRDRGLPYMTCSAKTGLHIESVFRAMASAALDMREVVKIEKAPSVKVNLAASGVGSYNAPRATKDDARGTSECC